MGEPLYNGRQALCGYAREAAYGTVRCPLLSRRPTGRGYPGDVYRNPAARARPSSQRSAAGRLAHRADDLETAGR